MRHGTLGGLTLILVAGYMLTGCSGAENAPRVVEGPPGPLAIRSVVEPPGGGTMHYVEQVTISLPGHKSLVLKTDVGGDVLAPYIRRQYELPGQRHLLLGHSSWGAGTETIQAILLGARGGRLERLDQLDVTTPRGISAVLLRQGDSQTRIGIFEPKQREMESGRWWMSRVNGEAAMPVFGPPPGNIRAGLVFMSSLVLGNCDEGELTGRRVAWFTIRNDRFQSQTNYPDINILNLSERIGSSGSRRPVTRFFGTSGNVYRIAYVIDAGKANEKTLNRLRSEIEKSLSRLQRSQQFVLIVAGKDKPEITPKEAFAPANAETKNKASRLVKSLRSGGKDDLLAAVKQAYKRHETDKGRSNTKLGRLIYILCTADPSDEVAEFIKTKQKDAPVKIGVHVYLFGEKGMTTSNAGKIAYAASGIFRVVSADATSRPASQPSD